MRNHHTSDASIDDAVNMFKAGWATIEEASRKPKAAERARTKPVKSKAHATDHFVFYQEKGRWLWDRMSDCNGVVRTCQHSFATYLDCVNNAKKYGWKGTPWFFLRPATDFYRSSRKSLRRSRVSHASSLRAV